MEVLLRNTTDSNLKDIKLFYLHSLGSRLIYFTNSMCWSYKRNYKKIYLENMKIEI